MKFLAESKQTLWKFWGSVIIMHRVKQFWMTFLFPFCLYSEGSSKVDGKMPHYLKIGCLILFYTFLFFWFLLNAKIYSWILQNNKCQIFQVTMQKLSAPALETHPLVRNDLRTWWAVDKNKNSLWKLSNDECIYRTLMCLFCFLLL